MKTINYFGDSRYEKIWEQMQLLGIQDVTTDRQDKNGTIVWRLPIKNWNSGKNLIFVTHYVVISSILSTTSSSGELIISDKHFSIIGRKKF